MRISVICLIILNSDATPTYRVACADHGNASLADRTHGKFLIGNPQKSFLVMGNGDRLNLDTIQDISPPILMTIPSPAHQRYQTAIAQLTTAIATSKPDLQPLVLEALAARDQLHALLQSPNDISGETLQAIAHLDQQLKAHAAVIDRCLQTLDWQTSFCPPATAWWWTLKPEPPNSWWNQDWLWQAVSITSITLALGLFGDVSTRFLKDGPDTFGAIAISAQSIGTLLTAGGALTVAGQEANKRLLKRIKLPEHYWHELGAGGSVMLLLGAIGLRLSLPQIATLYSDWGYQNYQAGDWGTAEALYKRTLQLNPDDDQASFRLGLLYEELQDLTQARTHYQAAARSGIPEAINNLSRLNLRDKKTALVPALLLKALEKADQLTPATHYVLLKNLGWARLQQGNYGDAEARLQAAITLQETDKLVENSTDSTSKTAFPIASPHCLLAQVKTAQGNKTAALDAWETCNTAANPYIPEEDEWAITARKQLKKHDQQPENTKKNAR